MHKDLSDHRRDALEYAIRDIVEGLNELGESLAISREVMINAFDKAAEDMASGQGA